MGTQQFTPTQMVNLADLVNIGKDLVELLNNPKAVKSFLSEVDSIKELVDKAKSVEDNLIELGKLKQVNVIAYESASKENEKLAKAKAELNVTKAILTEDKKAFDLDKSKLDTLIKDNEALKVNLENSLKASEDARLTASKEAQENKAKNLELDTKIAEFNNKLSKLKEV